MDKEQDLVKLFLQKINALPDDQKKDLFGKVDSALKMGLRAIVLEEAPLEDRERIAQMLEADDDHKFMDYGFLNIPDFAQKYNQVINDVAAGLAAETESLQ